MIKLIMSDMDGTLLDGNGRLPPRFDEVMAKLAERGILFAPASGRPYYGLLRAMEKYRDFFVFIAENGNYAAYRGKEIFSASMDRELVRSLLEVARQIPGAQPVICGKKGAYIFSDENKVLLKEIKKYYAGYSVIASFAEVDDEVLKIAVCDFSEKGAEYNACKYYLEYEGDYKAVVSGERWLDLMKPGINKGVASKKIQERFGFKPEECMAFGDYLNDFELMQSVYYSYAMENAHPKIKEAARFRAKSNEEYGVIAAIEAMLETSGRVK